MTPGQKGILGTGCQCCGCSSRPSRAAVKSLQDRPRLRMLVHHELSGDLKDRTGTFIDSMLGNGGIFRTAFQKHVSFLNLFENQPS